MATPLHIKRMTRERRELESADRNSYLVCFDDDNLLTFTAYVVGPDDSLYQHKLVKLRFTITEGYPIKPPKVEFIQHTGDRIHPNLYVEEKVCLSILGTWSGPGWAMGMTCHTVLVTIQSLLDMSPYQHEPSQRDNPGYNRFVQYATWKCLLLDYLERETNPRALAFLQDHIVSRAERISTQLTSQQRANAGLKTFSSPYSRQLQCKKPEYPVMIGKMQQAIEKAKAATAARPPPPPELVHESSGNTDESERRPQQEQEQKRSAVVLLDDDEDEQLEIVQKRKKTVEIVDLT